MDELKKVLMIAPTPFFADRGCHTRILEEVRALTRRMFDVVLCTYGLGRDIEDVRTVRCYNFPWYKKLSAGPSGTKIMLLGVLAAKAFRCVREFDPDVVHCHLHEGAIIGKLLRIVYPRKIYIFDAQGSLHGELGQHMERLPWPSLLRMVERFIIRRFTLVVSSENVRQEMIGLGAEPERVIMVGDGVDSTEFAPRPADHVLAGQLGIDMTKPRVLFMGLLEQYQGIDLLLEAFAILKLNGIEFSGVIIGYPNEEKYGTRALELGIGDVVKFLGRVQYEKVADYLALSDIAVAPKISTTEGDGKLYNYMSMGMAVVAFDRPVSKDILGDTGLYADIGSAQSLADQIRFLIENPQCREDFGRRARARAIERFSWDAVIDGVMSAYEMEILRRNASRVGTSAK